MRVAMRALAIVALVAGCAPARKAGSCDGPCPASKIDHVIVIVQENHTFDSYLGRWCTAPAGSNPGCTDGPGCCEAAPATEPGGSGPVPLDDAENAAYDPSHLAACETDEIDGGKMDRFVSSTICGDPRNFAIADPGTLAALADRGALADHWFQPTVGQSSANDMYLARAAFVFPDNMYGPDSLGRDCTLATQHRSFGDQTIYDLLAGAGVSFAWYAEGYQAMKDAEAQGHCPDPPDACGFGLSLSPCVFDAGDVPLEYYAAFKDDPVHMRDLAQLTSDLSSGTLPQVVFVKPVGYHSEHPGLHTTISAGTSLVSNLINEVDASDYAPDALTLLLYDEGGGFFDHVAPPPTSPVDNQPYGTRVPAIALGPFARAGTISHTTLEHSSLVRFLEWNWLGAQTGQLGTRDATVANLGSLLDGTKTGAIIPD
jgi:phospholipase C